MSDDSGEEKKLPPTDHHLEKLRQKGNFPLSEDFHAAVASVVKVLVLYFGASTAGAAMVGLLLTPFQMPVAPESIVEIARKSIFLFTLLFFTVSGLGAVAYVVARAIDGGGLTPHFNKVSLKFSNIDPVKGIKNKFKMRGLSELLKGMLKVLIIVCGFSFIIWPHVGAIFNAAGCGLGCSAPLIADLVLKFVFLFLVLQVASATIDLKTARLLFRSENKMSHSDQKRENRDVGGDPMIKGEQASFRNELLESSGSPEQAGGAGGPSPAVESGPADERKIVVYSDGVAMTLSINLTGDFNPKVVDRFTYAGEAPPSLPDVAMVRDSDSVMRLANLGEGRQIPLTVLRRVVDLISSGQAN